MCICTDLSLRISPIREPPTQPSTIKSRESDIAKMSSSFVVVHVSDVALCFGTSSVVAVKTLRDCKDVSQILRNLMRDAQAGP